MSPDVPSSELEYVGRWVSGDGAVREILHTDGTFEDFFGGALVRTGHYAFSGVFIFYWDDDNYTADGQLIGDMIDRYEYVLHKQSN